MTSISSHLCSQEIPVPNMARADWDRQVLMGTRQLHVGPLCILIT